MRARSHPEIASASEAYALLGLTGPADGEALTAAFRAAVKAARPGEPGGDEDRFRRVIAAWRLIQDISPVRSLAAPASGTTSPPTLTITPDMALGGGQAAVRLDGRSLLVSVPAGLRTGEHLRLRRASAGGADMFLPVLIRSRAGLSVVGDDLYMTWPVAPRLLEDGGRLEIGTHAGVRSAWLVGGCQPPRLRLKGLGLPARGRRPQGHLFVTLEPSRDAPSAAEDMLTRFTRVWTPDRLAA